MQGVHADGMDVLKRREVAKETINGARKGAGPQFVECETYKIRDLKEMKKTIDEIVEDAADVRVLDEQQTVKQSDFLSICPLDCLMEQQYSFNKISFGQELHE